MKIVKNGTVFVDGHFEQHKDIVINGDKISDICESGSYGSNMDEIDASGCYVLPGFTEIHIHAIHGCDTMDATEDSLKNMAKSLASHGVTSFLPTTITNPAEKLRNALTNISKLINKKTGGATVIGCHLEGPFINPDNKGAQPGEFILKPNIENYKLITGAHPEVVRSITLAPEMEGAEELTRYLAGKGIMVSCGHSSADFDTVEKSVEWGVTHATHLFNGMIPMHHRNPGIVAASLYDDNISVEMIADMIHLNPNTVKLAVKCKGYSRCILISDAMMATDLEDGDYQLGGQKVIVKGGVARLPEGNLAGSTLTLDRALRNMVNTVKIPAENVIPMLTENPAKAIHEDAKRGSIKKNNFADIVIMDKKFNVVKTIVTGDICYSA